MYLKQNGDINKNIKKHCTCFAEEKHFITYDIIRMHSNMYIYPHGTAS